MIRPSTSAKGALFWTLLHLGRVQALSVNAAVACAEIALSVNTLVDGTPEALLPDWLTATVRYWSQAAADQIPECVVLPTSAEEVSTIVTVLQKYDDVEFAMKSGGHNPNVGYSSVDGGVLISFANLATTTYSAKEGTVDIGPGARWGDVLTTLDPYNVAVVGGRIGKLQLRN